MLSRISKISVFGIVALMLAFGLATTDALAQTKGMVTVSVGDTHEHAAADEVTLVFTVDRHWPNRQKPTTPPAW